MRDDHLGGLLGGLRSGDLVAVSLAAGPLWPEMIAAVWRAGAALLPIDPRLPARTASALRHRARPTADFDGRELRRLPGGVPVEHGVGLVMASSGTTHHPKLAELGRGALVAAVTASARRLDAGPTDPWFGCLPVTHMGGMLVALRGVLLGAPVTLRPRFEPGEFDAFARAGAAFSAVVPTMLVRLLDARAAVDRLRAILVGGDSLAPAVASRARDAGAPIVRTYGLTETCGGVVYEGAPFDGVELRIAPDGEILLRGTVLMRRYRLDPQATEQAIDGEGWLHSGDAGELDQRRLRVYGRLDDAIVSGGEKIWPAEVEAVLRQHPAVADVAVAGLADPEWGQRVVAFVVPATPSAPPRLEELRAAVAERLPRFKAPRELQLVAEVPRTSSGKVRRTTLAGLPSA